MKSGNHQFGMEESQKEIKAFLICPLGFYEYCKMPFGLTNSPTTPIKVVLKPIYINQWLLLN